MGVTISEAGATVPTNKAPTRLVNQLIITGHVVVYGFTVFSTNVATQFAQYFDARDLPADGANPIIAVDCQTNVAKGVSWAPQGREFLDGFALCMSSTAGTKTLNATGDTLLDVQFDFIDPQGG